MSTGERVEVLLNALGIDEESFFEFLEWALSEHLVSELVGHPEVTSGLLQAPDALRRFRTLLESRTGRKWSQADYEALFEATKQRMTKHYRQPIKYEDLARLRDEEELACVECGARPPEAVMHIDHIFPASKGGSSRRENLQFLCAKHNLAKSDKVTKGEPWLELR